jgi:hypothetical protein
MGFEPMIRVCRTRRRRIRTLPAFRRIPRKGLLFLGCLADPDPWPSSGARQQTITRPVDNLYRAAFLHLRAYGGYLAREAKGDSSEVKSNQADNADGATASAHAIAEAPA